MKNNGIIISQKSNLYVVSVNGVNYKCRARGKFRHNNITPLVGDKCLIDAEDKYIIDIYPRSNKLDRPPIANVDVALIITSVKEPNLSLNLLDRELVCILNENIKPIICLTKLDLLNYKERRNIKKIFKYYMSIGIEVITNDKISKLKKLLKGKTVVLTGQTGAGKSTLINKLDKNFNLETNEISRALGRGVHTTRHTEIYNISGIFIADTPGFSSLDIKIEKRRLKELYPEFRVKCKFEDCNHIKEKGCRVKELVENAAILQSRYDNYVKFWSEL